MDKDIGFFRREYRIQKKLEHIVNSRPLHRPNVRKWQVYLCFALLVLLLSLTIFFAVIMDIAVAYKILVASMTMILIFEFYGRFCLIMVVKCYQSCAKEETRRRCKCIPSCSEYALICLKKKYPFILALIKIRKRLYRTCDGEEYRIDFPDKKATNAYRERIEAKLKR